MLKMINKSSVSYLDTSFKKGGSAVCKIFGKRQAEEYSKTYKIKRFINPLISQLGAVPPLQRGWLAFGRDGGFIQSKNNESSVSYLDTSFKKGGSAVCKIFGKRQAEEYSKTYKIKRFINPLISQLGAVPPSQRGWLAFGRDGGFFQSK
jgi:hypothetical protein